MICRHCGSDARPVLVMGSRTEGGVDMPAMVEACSACGKDVDQAAQARLRAIASASGEPAPASVSTKQETTDVVGMIRERLQRLESEIESMDAKRREADMLRRMLAAAEPERRQRGVAMQS